jgi:hypothetical protein
MDTSLLVLPLIWVGAQLELTEAAGGEFATSEVQSGELTEGINLLTKHEDLVFIPAVVSRDLYRVGDA